MAATATVGSAPVSEMKIVTMPREADEKLLEWVRRRHRGDRCADIGRDWGVSGNNVRDTTNRVRDHDAKHSGEDVKEHYW